jgi:histone H4
LARRCRIKRISDCAYGEVRDFADYFLYWVVKDSVIFAEHAKIKTITVLDVIYALKRAGRSLYGYGVWYKHIFKFYIFMYIKILNLLLKIVT